MFLKDVLLMTTSAGLPLDLIYLPDSDIIAYYRASEYSTGNWSDLSTNSHDATEGTNPPTAVANGGSIFNDQPVVRYDSVNDVLQTNSFSHSQPISYLAIVKPTTVDGVNQYIVDGSIDSSTTRAFLRIGTTERIQSYSGGSVLSDTSTASNSEVSVIQSYYDGANSYLKVNYLEVDSGDSGSGGIASGLTLGNDRTGANPFHGDIAEILVTNGEFTNSDSSYAAKYLNSKYNIPVWSIRQVASNSQNSYPSGSPSLTATFNNQPLDGSLILCAYALADLTQSVSHPTISCNGQSLSVASRIANNDNENLASGLYYLSANSTSGRDVVMLSSFYDHSMMYIMELVNPLGTSMSLNGTPVNNTNIGSTGVSTGNMNLTDQYGFLMAVHAFSDDQGSVSYLGDFSEYFNLTENISVGPDLTLSIGIDRNPIESTYFTEVNGDSATTVEAHLAGFKAT